MTTVNPMILIRTEMTKTWEEAVAQRREEIGWVQMRDWGSEMVDYIERRSLFLVCVSGWLLLLSWDQQNSIGLFKQSMRDGYISSSTDNSFASQMQPWAGQEPCMHAKYCNEFHFITRMHQRSIWSNFSKIKCSIRLGFDVYEWHAFVGVICGCHP